MFLFLSKNLFFLDNFDGIFWPVTSLKIWNEHEQSAPRQSFIVAFGRHCCVTATAGWTGF